MRPHPPDRVATTLGLDRRLVSALTVALFAIGVLALAGSGDSEKSGSAREVVIELSSPEADVKVANVHLP